MVTRVIGVPDSNGIIRVSCGNDTIEIEIVPSAPVITTAPTGPTINPVDIPYARITQQLSINPNDIPTTWIIAPSAANGRLDIKALIARILDQKQDPHQADPEAVIIDMPDANVHDLVDLSDQISRVVPGLPMALKFKSRLP